MKIIIDAKAGCSSNSSQRDSYREQGLRVSIKHPHKNNLMKTNPSFKIFKFFTLVPLGIAIAAALVTQPIHAGVIDSIVFTENSSTSLSVTFNGSTSGVTVTPGAPDNWTVVIPAVIFPGSGGIAAVFAWAEPGNVMVGNIIDFFAGSNEIRVSSDISGGAATFTNPNGSTITIEFPPLSMTFNDNARSEPTVPDPASTLGLLFLSLAGLLGLNRFRRVQLA